MPSPLPYFKLWQKDWLSSSGTRMLTLAERGLFLDLLCFQWEDGSIPDDIALIARMVGASEAEVTDLFVSVGTKFQKQDDGRLVNKRLSSERETAFSRAESARERGLKGGRGKATANLQQSYSKATAKLQVSNARTCALDMPSGSGSGIGTDSEEVPKEEEPTSRTRTALIEEAWAEVMRVFPARCGGNGATDGKRRFTEHSRKGEPLELLVQGAYKYRAQQDRIRDQTASSREPRGTGSQFVMMMSTFYGPKMSWKDEYALPPERVFSPNGRQETPAEQSARLRRELGLPPKIEGDVIDV